MLVVAVSASISWMLARGRLLGAIDVPNERSLHARPIPRTGGIAILSAIALGVAVSSVLSRRGSIAHPLGWLPVEAWAASVVAVAFGLIVTISLIDDFRGLTAGQRLACHVVASFLIALVSLRLDAVNLPWVGVFGLGWMAWPITMLGVVWMTNLYNFMDGMDGFAAGMTISGFGTIAIVASLSGDHALATFCVIVAAAAAGFLILNFPPSRIFMGDVGAVSIGFVAAVVGIAGFRRASIDPGAVALAFAPFVVDASVTLALRALRGVSLWKPHREHGYQRLVLAGWSHRRTVLAEYFLMALSSLAALVWQFGGDAAKAAIFVVTVGMAAAMARIVARAGYQRRP